MQFLLLFALGAIKVITCGRGLQYLIPLVGSILLLVELVRDSQPGPNRFGNPVI